MMFLVLDMVLLAKQSGSAIWTKQLRQTAALLPDGRQGWVPTGVTFTTKAGADRAGAQKSKEM